MLKTVLKSKTQTLFTVEKMIAKHTASLQDIRGESPIIERSEKSEESARSIRDMNQRFQQLIKADQADNLKRVGDEEEEKKGHTKLDASETRNAAPLDNSDHA